MQALVELLAGLLEEGLREFQQRWSNRARLRAAAPADAPDVSPARRGGLRLTSRGSSSGCSCAMRRRHVGVEIGVARGNRSWFVGSGTAGAGRPSPPLADTIFEIGSVTKLFTATLLAALVKDGTVTLQDPVQDYLPADVRLPVRGRAITLPTSHTAWLPRLPHGFMLRSLRHRRNPDAWLTVDDLYAGLPDTRLRREPGGSPRYSNLGYGLLGHVLSLRVGHTYDELVAQRTCRPLDLVDTVVQVPEPARARFAHGHNLLAQRVPHRDLPVLAARRCAALDRRGPAGLPAAPPRRG